MPDLTEIREALANATPGPWRAGVLAPCHTGVWGTQPDTDWNVCLTGDELTHYSIEDAHLIANAPAWLEALCDEVERLRREWKELADELEVVQSDRTEEWARAEKAEVAVERVRRLATLALYKGPEPADTHAVVLDSLAKELLAALDGE